MGTVREMWGSLHVNVLTSRQQGFRVCCGMLLLFLLLFLLFLMPFVFQLKNWVVASLLSASGDSHVCVSLGGHAVAELVEALCYKPKDRGFHSR
jgi:hypothetical protein